MATVSPFNVPASNQSQTNADGIYYGVMGLIANASFMAAMKLIVSDGIKAALTDADVIAALEVVLFNGVKQAVCDVAVIACLAEAGAQGLKDALQDPATDLALIDVVSTGIYEAIDDLVTAGIINFSDMRQAALIALASASIKNSSFISFSDTASLDDLKARVTALVTDVLTP